MHIEIEHHSTSDKVVAMLRDNLRQALPDSVTNFQSRWNDHAASFSGEAMGSRFSGAANVTNDLISIDIRLPLGASLFIDINELEAGIRKKVGQLIS